MSFGLYTLCRFAGTRDRSDYRPSAILNDLRPSAIEDRLTRVKKKQECTWCNRGVSKNIISRTLPTEFKPESQGIAVKTKACFSVFPTSIPVDTKIRNEKYETIE